MRALFYLVSGLAVAAGLFAAAPRLAHGQAPATPKEFPVRHTDAEWRQLLPPDSYQVLRHAATERPWTSPLLNEHRTGVFECAGCGQKLFESGTKFNSGTGWPSFWKAIKGAVIERPDYSDGSARMEVICARCGGHLGHVFDDGPRPTGLRYCMNGVALKFVPAKN